MVKKIVAIIAIFAVASVAWMVLGTSTRSRMYEQSGKLYGKVEGLWGARHIQQAPTFYYVTEKKKTIRQEDGKVVTVLETESHKENLIGSDITVDLDLTHRKKGLLWYDTYKVAFKGHYLIKNPLPKEQKFYIDFAFPVENAVYDNFQLIINGKPIRINDFSKEVITVPVTLAPNESGTLEIGYLSQGLDKWFYKFGDSVSRVENFSLTMNTNFNDIDFPENTISPSGKQLTANGWKLNWRYTNLISGFQIGMEMPDKLNPGPLASQISYFAPVSLLFFFAVVFMLTIIKGIKIHPMNYVFLAASFFAFHLLFAYTVDHLDIWTAFIISSLVSMGLVISYMRVVVGARFAALEVGLSQLVFLILFSLAHFFEGYTGLTVTVGAILTLAALMHLTARIDWDEKFKGL